MSAYDGYAAAATYGRMYGMAYPGASPVTGHYHVAAGGLQTAAAAAAAAAVGSASTVGAGPGTGPTSKTYNGLCLTGTGVDLLHPAMVYPGTDSRPPLTTETNVLMIVFILRDEEK